MIEVHQLVKRYGNHTAVDGISFEIGSGETFGLLGPNGAGKTTTILMAVGAIAPDSGEVRLNGQSDPTRKEIRREVGVVPQNLAIYEELTAEENIRFFSRIYGLSGKRLRERVDWGLDLAGLTDRRKDRAGTYSGGMKRRLNLACALAHEPKVLFCDEPTVGVDPQSRNHIFDSIERIKDGGCTLIYTTHYMEEATRLCDRVAIVDHGKVLAVGAVEDLVQEHGGSALVEAELTEVPADPSALPGTLEGTRLRIETDRPLEDIAALGKHDIRIERLSVERPDLERVFLHLTGRSLRD